MRTKVSIILILFSLSIFCESTFAQNKVYLSQFQPININKSFSLSATNLLRTYINMGTKYKAYIPENLDTLYNENLTSKGNKAKSFGCDYILKGELNRLGETVIVTVNLYRVSDSSVVWSDLLKASSPDDLDKIYERIAVNLGTDKKASKEADIYTVTQYQSKELTKEKANVSAGVGLGGMAVNLPYKANSLPAGFSGIVFYDARSFLGELSGDLYFGDNKFRYLSVNILANYAFKKKQNTPYIGGGLSLNSIWYTEKVTSTSLFGGNSTFDKDVSNGGLSAIIGGGYIFNRTGSVKIRSGVKLVLPTYQINDNYPFGAIFHLDILFGS